MSYLECKHYSLGEDWRATHVMDMFLTKWVSVYEKINIPLVWAGESALWFWKLDKSGYLDGKGNAKGLRANWVQESDKSILIFLKIVCSLKLDLLCF